ncbi:MAG: NADH-quinone oxidoreductase subunit F [Rhodospirillaceae bacterium]|nr:NADH-quinone oxidoreductase subunit F [Rhodospirillaceae bacterium]
MSAGSENEEEPNNQASNRLGRPPGAGRGKGRTTLRGRQSDAASLAEISDVLGVSASDPGLLVEYLHLLQDGFGALRTGHLTALADNLRLSLAEVYEVATFYHRFEVVADDMVLTARTIHICDGLPCQMAGADDLAQAFADTIPDDVRVVRSACMGRCDCAPVASCGTRYIGNADGAAMQALATGAEMGAETGAETDAPWQPSVDFEQYQANGGYDLLRQCYDGTHQPGDIMARVEASGLRGLGGAGFPTGRKWNLVAAEPGPRILAVNGDESEPGTFKDRHYLESDPHRFLEGMLLAAWAVDASEIYIYLRDEYPHLRHLLRTELDRIVKAGLSKCEIHLRRGAGAYICGEESAMLESLEGKRGLPRQRPPFPSQSGLFGRPTLINNVETLYWIREAFDKGDEFADMRSFSVSGRVRQPGVKFVPRAISARTLIEEYCGGMADGHELTAFLPGGASGGILPASLADEPMDFGTLEQHGGLIGSAALIVLSQADQIAGVVDNLMRFFAHESCGQCTPCRVGTEKAVAMLASGKSADTDAAYEDLAQVMADASICGLGQAAANPIRCALRHFPGAITVGARK